MMTRGLSLVLIYLIADHGHHSFSLRFNTEGATRFTQCGLSRKLTGSLVISRRQLLGAAATASSILTRPKQAGCAEDANINKSLVTFLRARTLIKNMKDQIVTGQDTSFIRGQVKYIVKDLQLRKRVYEASPLLGGGSDRARLLGNECIEYLSQIIEFDAFDDINNDTTSRIARKIDLTNQKAAFNLKSLEAADQKLELLMKSFPEIYMEAAEQVYTMYYGDN